MPYRWKRPAIKRPGSISYLFCAALGVAILCAAAPANADRQPGSLSTIKKNPSSGNIEIIHRLHNHDAELGIIAARNDLSLTLDKLVGRAQLALYVERRFLIAAVVEAGIGAPLELTLIGAELDGDYVLVYQEFSGELPSTIAVRNDILRDVFPAQVNQVNIALGGRVRSLVFSGSDEWHVTNRNQGSSD